MCLEKKTVTENKKHKEFSLCFSRFGSLFVFLWYFQNYHFCHPVTPQKFSLLSMMVHLKMGRYIDELDTILISDSLLPVFDFLLFFESSQVDRVFFSDDGRELVEIRLRHIVSLSLSELSLHDIRESLDEYLEWLTISDLSSSFSMILMSLSRSTDSSDIAQDLITLCC